MGIDKLSWKIQSDEFYAFEKYLIDNNIEFHEENDTFVITHEGDVDLGHLQSLPDSIQFNNEGYVYLYSLQSLPDNIIFNNGGDVWLNSLKSLPDSIQFNNGGDVFLNSLQSLPENKYEIFKNNGIVRYYYYKGLFDPRIKEKLSWKEDENEIFIYVKPDKNIPLEVEEAHVTVIYCRNKTEKRERTAIIKDISDILKKYDKPILSFNGVATFNDEDKSKVILINFEEGASLYSDILSILEKYLKIDKDYDFIPHMTIDKNISIKKLPEYKWKSSSLFIEFDKESPATEIKFQTGKTSTTSRLNEV